MPSWPAAGTDTHNAHVRAIPAHVAPGPLPALSARRPVRPTRRPARAVLAWTAALSLAVLAVGSVGSGPSEAGVLSVEASLSPADRVVVDSVRSAFSADLAAREAAFAAVDSLSDREARLLRRSRNAAHVGTARRLGVAPVATDSALAAVGLGRSGLERLAGESPYYATRRGRPALAPDALAALDAIGERFQERLSERGLPAFRYVVSSAFRTAEHQDRLRGVNANAARGTSSHEFGTTFDIAYRRYRAVPAGDAMNRVPAGLPTRVRLWLAAELNAAERAWAERAAVAHAGRLEAELGRALVDLEDAGVLLALREVRQPCFHVTVAQRLG